MFSLKASCLIIKFINYKLCHIFIETNMPSFLPMMIIFLYHIRIILKEIYLNYDLYDGTEK